MWGDPSLQDTAPGDFNFFGGAANDDILHTAGNHYNIGGAIFFCKNRYKPKALVGRGAFGIVW